MKITDNPVQKEEMQQAIRNWMDNRDNKSVLERLFAIGNAFCFELEDELPADSYLHAYPSITESGNLQFIVIPSQYDVKNAPDGAFSHATQCNVQVHPFSHGLGGPLPEEVAIKRMEDWDNEHVPWISENVATPNGIYEALVIPADDIITGDVHWAFFALKTQPAATGGFAADLIIYNQSTMQIVYPQSISPLYYDMVRPVPPYGGEGTKREAFYLLNSSIGK